MLNTVECSTPFGICDENTIGAVDHRALPTGAQRLSASVMKTLGFFDGFTTSTSLCSTPFGICDENTSTRLGRICVDSVLNAFRHL